MSRIQFACLLRPSSMQLRQSTPLPKSILDSPVESPGCTRDSEFLFLVPSELGSLYLSWEMGGPSFDEVSQLRENAPKNLLWVPPNFMGSRDQPLWLIKFIQKCEETISKRDPLAQMLKLHQALCSYKIGDHNLTPLRPSSPCCFNYPYRAPVVDDSAQVAITVGNLLLEATGAPAATKRQARAACIGNYPNSGAVWDYIGAIYRL